MILFLPFSADPSTMDTGAWLSSRLQHSPSNLSALPSFPLILSLFPNCLRVLALESILLRHLFEFPHLSLSLSLSPSLF